MKIKLITLLILSTILTSCYKDENSILNQELKLEERTDLSSSQYFQEIVEALEGSITLYIIANSGSETISNDAIIYTECMNESNSDSTIYCLQHMAYLTSDEDVDDLVFSLDTNLQLLRSENSNLNDSEFEDSFISSLNSYFNDNFLNEIVIDDTNEPDPALPCFEAYTNATANSFAISLLTCEITFVFGGGPWGCVGGALVAAAITEAYNRQQYCECMKSTYPNTPLPSGCK